MRDANFRVFAKTFVQVLYNSNFINNIFNLIKVVIDFNNKLYKKIIEKQYN